MFDVLDGEYDVEGSGSFKQLYRSTDGQYLVFRPEKGEDVRDRLENVLAWEQNLQALEERGVDVPMDEYQPVVAPVSGEPTALLVCDYDPTVEEAGKLPEDRRACLEDRFDEYAETIEAMMEDGEFIALDSDEYRGFARERNMGYTEDDGAVVLDFGEAGRPEGIDGVLTWLFGSRTYKRREKFLQDNGVHDWADAVLGERSLYDRVRDIVSL